MSIQNDGITERSREAQAAYERGYRAGIEAAANGVDAFAQDEGAVYVHAPTVVKAIRALAPSSAPRSDAQGEATAKCPTCADTGWISWSIGCELDVSPAPCPACAAREEP